MTEERNQLAELFAACWKDEALKARFMSDPKAVLAERGIDNPDNIDVKVVENSDNTVHITMPMPPDGHEELSMEELIQVAGGEGTVGSSSWNNSTIYPDLTRRPLEDNAPSFGRRVEQRGGG